MSSLQVKVLGCGASAGVPLIGCECVVCTSKDPRNQRLRVSILIEQRGQKLLVDTSPDIRRQCLANGIRTVDAILYTHAHADHCHGIDDLRPLNFHRGDVIPTYGEARAMEEIVMRFDYAFKEPIPEYGWFRPALKANIVDPSQSDPIQLGRMQVRLFPQTHGRITTLGLRVGNFAYSTDVNHLPEEAFKALEGVEVWMVDCLRYDPSPTHAHLELTLEWIRRVKPKRAILTHMSHDFDYEAFCRELPEGVEPAYDGMLIELDA
jgi:phosphoribosyl 1,2-cyclic phosphate phosphodiesterase